MWVRFRGRCILGVSMGAALVCPAAVFLAVRQTALGSGSAAQDSPWAVFGSVATGVAIGVALRWRRVHRV